MTKEISDKFIDLKFNGSRTFLKELLPIKSYLEKNNAAELVQIPSNSFSFGSSSYAIYHVKDSTVIQEINTRWINPYVSFKIVGREKEEIAKSIKYFYDSKE